MARRGWVRSIGTAVLAAAALAAAQLGLGYGLGIITWGSPGSDATGATPGAWPASLAWATWVAATSVVAGALIADRGGRHSAAHRTGRTADEPATGSAFVRMGWRVVIALSAAIGAMLAVPLFAYPVRDAQIADNYAPHILAGVFTAAGVVLGLLVALFALASRAVAANVCVNAVWLWVLAVVALVDADAQGGAASAQLAVWKFTEAGPVWRSFYIPGALLMLGSALLIGGLAAFPAAGRSDGRFGVAASGAFGPLLVAVAYILASPSAGEVPNELSSAYVTAPYMIVAGLAGSVLVAVVGGVGRGSAAAASTPPDYSDLVPDPDEPPPVVYPSASYEEPPYTATPIARSETGTLYGSSAGAGIAADSR
jgi:hypothetical protein